MAADKKLNSVGSVSDAAFVYAETLSGETVKISKADLASVVANNLGIKRMSIEVQEGETKTIEMAPPYSGIMSITCTTYVGYSLFYVRGYGSGSARNSVTPLTTGGITDNMEFSFLNDMSGFVVKNNTAKATINIFLF